MLSFYIALNMTPDIDCYPKPSTPYMAPSYSLLQGGGSTQAMMVMEFIATMLRVMMVLASCLGLMPMLEVAHHRYQQEQV